MGIPPKRQAHKHAVSYAILFDSLRRKPGDQRSQVLKRRARTVYDAAKRGDTAFVRAVGRLLSGKGESDYLKRFKYAHAMLSHWLTAYYWLMPAKLVSYRLSLGLGVKDNLKSLLATKARYGLKSHRPTLIYGFERVRDTPGIEAIILTNPEGKRLLGPKGKPLPH
jgi:hypothetical protein